MSEALPVKLTPVQVHRPHGTLPENWEELKPKVVALRQAGRSLAEIERALQLSRYLVRRALADMGVPMGHIKYAHRRMNIPRERMEELIAQGLTRRQIEKTLGISNRGLLGLLARHGLTVADPLEQNRKLAGQGLWRCCMCGKIKSLETDYYATVSARTGKSSRCKTCSTEHLRLYHQRVRARRSAAPQAQAAARESEKTLSEAEGGSLSP